MSEPNTAGDPIPRRALAWTFLRAGLIAASLVTLYYVLPLNGRFSHAAYVLLPVGLVVFGLVTRRELRALVHARDPRMRLIQLLATVIPLFVVVMATTYFIMSRNQQGAFSEHLDRTDALYFTMTVLSTLGFGDIAPLTHVARIAVMLQIVGDLVVLGAGVHVLTGAVKTGMAQRHRRDGTVDS